MNNLSIIQHPLALHKLTILRDQKTDTQRFRKVLKELCLFLVFEATKNIEVIQKEISTPLMKTKGYEIKNTPIIVSILRAGEGMIDGLLELLPNAKVGHIGIYNDKFINNTVEYFFRIPECKEEDTVFLVDPIVASGDTVLACLDRLYSYGIKNIKILSILVSPESLKAIKSSFPNVEVISMSLEEKIDEKGKILPGLGDVSERLFNA